MQKTVKCRLDPTPEQAEALLDTMIQFAAACNFALAIAKEQKIKRAFALHKSCYYDLRERFGLLANYAVRAMARVCSAFGKGKKPPKAFKPTSLDLDVRLFAYNGQDELVSIATLNGRRQIRLRLGDYQRQQLAGQNPKAATLNFDEQTKKFYINLVIEIETPEPSGEAPLGIDRGINRIAADSQGNIYSGRRMKQKRAKFARTRTRLQQAKAQRSQSRNVYKALKRLSGREARYAKDVNHGISKKIVQTAKEGTFRIVLEDLAGIRQNTNGKKNDKPKRNKAVRTLLNRWSFFQLGQFIVYKAMGAGVDVNHVPGAYTSKTCSVCLHIGSRSGHRFSCDFCGNTMDAELNAAQNIAALGVALYQPARFSEPLCCSYGQHSQNALHAAASNSILNAKH